MFRFHEHCINHMLRKVLRRDQMSIYHFRPPFNRWNWFSFPLDNLVDYFNTIQLYQYIYQVSNIHISPRWHNFQDNRKLDFDMLYSLDYLQQLNYMYLPYKFGTGRLHNIHRLHIMLRYQPIQSRQYFPQMNLHFF